MAYPVDVAINCQRGMGEYAMSKTTHNTTEIPEEYSLQPEQSEPDEGAAASPLDQIVREGARKMLQAALEAEVQDFLKEHQSRTDQQGRRQVVRNGTLPPREILTGAGPLEVKQPRVRDNHPDPDQRVRFSSKILPAYLRKSKTIEELVPWLYLKGISTGDFPEALQALLGEDAKGFSPNVVVRLKQQWEQEYQQWKQRDLSDKHYVYIWADGIYANVRLEDAANKRQCLLVLMGATAEGKKELIAVEDGFRESEQSWYEVLLGLKQRGLEQAPLIAVGDGALGFWAALRKVYPSTREQRCWVHKTANVLNGMPKSVQAKAKGDLHEIWQAETRQDAQKAFQNFLQKYAAKYDKACGCLEKDEEVLLSFYDFPAEHWKHLRTTNPIESTFATIRLRHRKTKGNGTRMATLTMMFKLAQSAEKRWQRLAKRERLIPLLQGKVFKDGVLQEAA